MSEEKVSLPGSETSEITEPKRNSQARDWCFTVNNPTQTEDEFLAYLQTLNDLRYVVFQREKAPKTETEHYQGYFEFTQPKWFSTVKNYLSKTAIGVDAHIEQRRKKRSQAREYCMEADTRISPQYYEWGKFVEDGERTDLNDIIAMIRDGATLKDIKTAYPAQYFRYYKNIEFLFNEHMAEKFCEADRNIKVIYIWGPPRIGKSRSVDKLYGRKEYFRVNKYKNPFDQYGYEPVLVLDEFDSQIDITYLNNLLDSLPCQLECRYNDKWAAWHTVYIISNLPFERQYVNEQPEKKAALKSRISDFIHFTSQASAARLQSETPAEKPVKFTQTVLMPLDDDGDLPF